MTTDSRTNEPTEAQVEAAAKAIADCHNPGMFEKYPENWRIEARAALVAAQGAAPQAECDCGAGPGSAVCKKVCATRAPVLPSSGVDENKLAELIENIIRENWEMFDDRRHQAQVIARAVAEWLKEQGVGKY